jgi:hypothetical protein
VPKGIQQDAQEFNKNLITALENLFERCPDQAKRTGLLEGLNAFKGKQSYDKDSLYIQCSEICTLRIEKLHTEA